MTNLPSLMLFFFTFPENQIVSWNYHEIWRLTDVCMGYWNGTLSKNSIFLTSAVCVTNSRIWSTICEEISSWEGLHTGHKMIVSLKRCLKYFLTRKYKKVLLPLMHQMIYQKRPGNNLFMSLNSFSESSSGKGSSYFCWERFLVHGFTTW